MSTADPATWRSVAHVMGMPVSVALRGRHAGSPTGTEAWHEVVALLESVDRDYSPYRADSWVSRVDRGEATLGEGPAGLREVVALGEAARRDSDGAFDVWRADQDGRRCFDPSGVVKGWAAQRASLMLTWLPETDVCLSVGGDLVCRTADPTGTPWQVGIEHPLHPARVVARVPVVRGGVATSGLSHRGGHVVDARTGQVPVGIASVTVLADDVVTADIDATAALALGAAGPAWLRRRGRTAVVVRSDGSAEVVAA
ncbi:FAD:protein FMN transferase [Nocardioides aestuarii]|uniref:FAD:protein FMN transferase n=1 Tax=Nocardioides aestuarii TaxID=252231 RepID=A0ABW4TQX4_9ACTN